VSAQVDEERRCTQSVTLGEVREASIERREAQGRAPMTMDGSRRDWLEVADDLDA